MVIVSDTTTISNLIIIEHIHLLNALYGTIIIPEAVKKELLQLTSHSPAVNAFLTAPWVEIKTVQYQDELKQIKKKLDAGEAEAIALAKELKASLLIMDEKKGRKYATSYLKIDIIGTLGILVDAKKESIIDAVKPLITRLKKEAGFWTNDLLIKEVLLSVQEFE